MKRRDFLGTPLVGAVALSAGGVLLPNQALAYDPIVMSGLVMAIIPSMVSAISGMIQQNKQHAMDKEKLALEEKWQSVKMHDSIRQSQARYISDWLSVGIQSGQISYKVAVDAYSKTLASLQLSNNFDGANTYVAVKDGVMYLERGSSAGTLHAASTEFATAHYQGTGRLPVPVDSSRQLDRADVHKAIDKVASTLKMDGFKFNQDYALASERKFSSATNPTKSGSDVSLYTAFNRKSLEQGHAQAYFLAA